MGLARWPETRHDRCRFTLGLDCFFGSLYGLKRGFLLMAQKTIPMGTAYAVWTGIGAVGAFVLIDDMDPVLAAVDGIHRALTEADQAGKAFLRIDVVRNQLLAGQRRAPFLFYVCLILISEVA